MDDVTTTGNSSAYLPTQVVRAADAAQLPWDALLARRLVAPLAHTRVTPNHLTTVRLAVGLAGAASFCPGTYATSNLAALLLVVSNFLDHADGELARLSGKMSRFGLAYDLASDALVTILLFVSIGVGLGAAAGHATLFFAIGTLVGLTVALIFYLRMRIENMAGKLATRQASVVGFETEDVLYLLPLVTLFRGLGPMLWLATVCAPLYAFFTLIEYRQIERRRHGAKT